MATKKTVTTKKSTTKKATSKKPASKPVSKKTASLKKEIKKRAPKKAVAKKVDKVKKPGIFKRIGLKVRGYRARRPHKSFELTKRRDYMRSLKMPGYFSFSRQVLSFLWKEKKTFLLLVLVMVVLQMVLVGMMSQDTYQSFANALDDTSANVASGSFDKVMRAGLLLVSSASTGGLNQSPTEIQQVFSALIFIIIWLVTIWLLRMKMAGNKVKLRDGLYNACAPLMSTLIVAVMLFIQAVPALVAFILYGAAVQTDFLANPFAAVVFWIVAGALVLISLYLVIGTLLALIVVTQPGRYPLDAVKMAGDLVVGRRLRILLRTAWSFVIMALMWAVVMIPVILFDGWIKTVVSFVVDWPIVPVMLLTTISISLVFFSTYVYMFYRRIIDDGASPA